MSCTTEKGCGPDVHNLHCGFPNCAWGEREQAEEPSLSAQPIPGASPTEDGLIEKALRVTFEAFLIETAPKWKTIMLWCPGRSCWRRGKWDKQEYHRKPQPYWSTQDSFVDLDRKDQPTHWAECDAMRLREDKVNG